MTNRLTKEDILSFPITPYGRSIGKQLASQVVQELLGYKKLEEQIGCPLEVLVKLTKQDELYCQFFNELQHHKRIKVDLKNGLVWYCKQTGGHYACRQPLSNYGKTFIYIAAG